MPSTSRPPPGQGRSRQPAAANDVVPAAITFAALGLDSSQAEVLACLLLPDGREVVPRWTIPNSLPGAEHLAERVQAFVKEQGMGGAAHRVGSDGAQLVASGLLSPRDPVARPWSSIISTSSILPWYKG